jgi:hypothetical protein
VGKRSRAVAERRVAGVGPTQEVARPVGPVRARPSPEAALAAAPADVARWQRQRESAVRGEDLAQLVVARRRMDGRIERAVEWQREAGRSWAEIAKTLGVTRQAAWARYGANT